MTNPELTANPERASETELLELLQHPGTCLLITELEDEDEDTSRVAVASHPFPIGDLLQVNTIVSHLERSDEARSGSLRLKMASDWKWGFDDPSFRQSPRRSGNIVTTIGDFVPVRRVCVSFEMQGGDEVDFHFVTLDR